MRSGIASPTSTSRTTAAGSATPGTRGATLIPGEGTIDFHELYTTLAERGYDGALTLEVSALDASGKVDEQRFRAAESWLRERPWLLAI